MANYYRKLDQIYSRTVSRLRGEGYATQLKRDVDDLVFGKQDFAIKTTTNAIHLGWAITESALSYGVLITDVPTLLPVHYYHSCHWVVGFYTKPFVLKENDQSQPI